MMIIPDPHSLIREVIDSLESVNLKKPGRPNFMLNMCNIENLLSMNFRLTEIAKIIGVSVRTLHRRLSAAETSVRLKLFARTFLKAFVILLL